MKVRKVKGWKCPECDAIMLEEDNPLPEIEDYFQCDECERIYEDRDEAKECCRDRR